MKEMRYNKTCRKRSLIKTLGITALALLMLVGIAGASPYAYIGNSYNQVSFIDTATHKVTDTVTVGSSPFGVAVTPDEKKVYVTTYDNAVSVIDTATKTVTSVKVGKNPQGIAINSAGTKVYVANYGSDTVSVIDTATNTVTATVYGLSYPLGIAVSPDGTKVYVTNTYAPHDNEVSIIDTATNTVTDNMKVGWSAYGVAVNPSGTKIYVTDRAGNFVSVIDAQTKDIATVNVGSFPGAIAVSPDGKRVYVANEDSNNVSVIDTVSNKVIATPYVGSRPVGIAVTPDGLKVFVTSAREGSVSVIDTATNALIDTVDGLDSACSFGQFIVPKARKNTVIQFNPETINVKLNSAQNVQIVMNKVPDTGLAGFNITVSVADPTIATITGVSGPNWAGVSDNSSVPAGSVWIHAVDVNGKVHAGDTNVSFGSINITGLKQGQTNLNIIPTEVTDLNGSPITPDVSTCKVNVITIPPFPGCKYPPQDLDNDGLYEDINGNGRLESADVVVFFKNTQWVIDNGLVPYFDFNHDGRINSADVIKLFKKL